MSKSASKLQRAVSPVQPYAIGQLLAGLENGPADDVLLSYLAQFCAEVPVKNATFIHVLPQIDVLAIEDLLIGRDNLVLPDNEDVLPALRNKLKERFGEMTQPKITAWTGEGNPLEVLLRNASEIQSDLLAIGQKSETRSHGITAKNLIRHTKCDTLLVPDKAKYRLKKILVPVDFSENSGKALRMAVALALSAKSQPKIEVLHVYELPSNWGTYRISNIKLLDLIREERLSSLPEFLNQYLPEETRKGIKLSVVESGTQALGQQIVQYAKRKKHDLIVTGVKGHSKLSLLLLGSVTEKILSTTTQTPVFVVK